MSWPQNNGEFRLGDFQVQSGEIIRDARLVWKTHGTLAPGRDNVVLYPCSYGAKHEDLEWLIGPDGILDPRRWFIVIPGEAPFTGPVSVDITWLLLQPPPDP